MPLERVSQGFQDLSMSFKANPLNYDLIAIKNETAIARSVRNIVLTNPGEKFFQPYFGTSISNSLFENMDELTASTIKNRIELSIENFEPRVKLVEVVVNPDYDNNTFDVTIYYNIIGINAETQGLSFALQPTR